MIKINGNFYKLNSSKDEILSFVEDASIKAYQAIDNFLDAIGIDKNLFTHLKELPIIIDNNKCSDKVAAYYIVRDNDLNEPTINLISTYIDNMIKEAKTDGNYCGSVNQVAWSIVHETIHSNRCIIINNIITLQDTNIRIDGDLDNYKSIYYELEELLSKYYSLNKKNTNYDILKIIIDDDFIDIYVYNEENDKYEFYLFNKDEMIITNIEKELNNNYKNKYDLYEPYAVIKRISKYNEEDMCMNFYNKNIDIPFTDEIGDQIKKRIELNEGIEEALTETFAGLIMIMNYDKSLNIYEACDILYNMLNNYDIKLSIDLIRNMNKDDIKWFFLSCYQEEYNNRFNSIIKEDYIRLLECFDILYKNSSIENNTNRELYYEGRNIIYKNSPYKQLKK